jgi:hypothetical protein
MDDRGNGGGTDPARHVAGVRERFARDGLHSADEAHALVDWRPRHAGGGMGERRDRAVNRCDLNRWRCAARRLHPQPHHDLGQVSGLVPPDLPCVAGPADIRGRISVVKAFTYKAFIQEGGPDAER